MNKVQTKETVVALLDAIRTNGLDNVSLLSEKAGIPIETARYMIWHELPGHFVSLDVDIDFESLGLRRWMIEFTPSESSSTGRRIHNGILGGGAGVVYAARVVPVNSYVAFLAIPLGDHYKLWMELEHLSKAGLIHNYSLKEIRLMRSISLNPSFYSFRESQWSFSWEDVDKYEQEIKQVVGDHLSFSEESKILQVDYKDILILREFERRIPKSISGLAKSLHQDPFNIRYHYNQHARYAIRNYRIKVIPKKPQSRCTFVFLFGQEGGDDLARARSTALSLPFTDSEWMMEKEYGWSVSCPGEYANELFQHVSRKFTRIKGNLRFLMLDSASEFRATIPWQFFDSEAGKWNYAPSISAIGPYAGFQELKNMCKYEVEGRCFQSQSNPKACAISSCPFVTR